jgi:hypothetical protein
MTSRHLLYTTKYLVGVVTNSAFSKNNLWTSSVHYKVPSRSYAKNSAFLKSEVWRFSVHYSIPGQSYVKIPHFCKTKCWDLLYTIACLSELCQILHFQKTKCGDILCISKYLVGVMSNSAFSKIEVGTYSVQYKVAGRSYVKFRIFKKQPVDIFHTLQSTWSELCKIPHFWKTKCGDFLYTIAYLVRVMSKFRIVEKQSVEIFRTL